MSYRYSFVVLLFSTFFANTAFSQNFFGSPPVKPGTTQKAVAPSKFPQATPNPVVSPSDYKSLVQSQIQQSDNALSQETNQQLTKKPNIPPSPNNPPVDDGSTSSTDSGANVTKPATVPATPLPPSPATAPTTAPVTVPPAPPPPVTTVPSTPPAQSPDTYTGFGPGNNGSGGNTAPAKKDSSSGWNITY